MSTKEIFKSCMDEEIVERNKSAGINARPGEYLVVVVVMVMVL